MQQAFDPKTTEIVLLHVAAKPKATALPETRFREALLPRTTLRTATKAGVSTHPVGVASKPSTVGTESQVVESERRQVSAAFDPLCDELSEQGYACCVHVAFGKVSRAIAATVDALSIDTVVITRRDHPRRVLHFRGSLADRILATVRVPVVVLGVRFPPTLEHCRAWR